MPLKASKIGLAVSLSFFVVVTAFAADKSFHGAPESAKATKNPYQGQATAVAAGKTLYARNCLACHGRTGQGTGNVPSLVDGKLEGVTPGEVFWFITKGSKDNGMPPWEFLPEQQRWQIVSFVESMGPEKVHLLERILPHPKRPPRS